jgi:cobalamin biosynthesis protein CobT
MAALESAAEKVARTIAQDHGIRVVVGGVGASYDYKTKTLSMPAYSQDPDDPMLAAAHRGTLDHELSHVIFTNFDAWGDALERWQRDYGIEKAMKIKTLTNLYEDHWIEPAYGQKWPGAKYHFVKKNEYVVAKTGGAKPCDPNHVPDGSFQPMGIFGAFTQAVLRTAPNRRNVPLTEVHPDVRGLMDACEEEITKGLAAKTTLDAIIAAEETWKKLEELAEPEPEQQSGDGDGEGQEQGDPGEAGDASGSESGEGSDPGGQPQGPDGEEESSGGSSSGDGSPDGDSQEGAAEGTGAGDETDGSDAGSEGADDSGVAEAADGPNSPNDDPFESSEPGGGAGGRDVGEYQEAAAQAIGGDWAEVKSDAEVIGNQYIKEIPPQYTVHPDSKARDRYVQYSPSERKAGREQLAHLEEAAGPAVKKLQSYLQGAFQASRQCMVIGGMEDGDDLDECALPGIALGQSHRDIFTTTVRAVEESTFVTVLVDCSGSMGRSGTITHCKTHNQEHAQCVRYGKKGCETQRSVHSKAGYAAITAMAIHNALRQLQVPHSVLGYSTGGRGVSGRNPHMPNGYLQWSRMATSMCIKEFVPAPGITDDGSALPYITGGGANLDGESVLFAAKHAAEHGGQYDRVILMVVADGLPAGADDSRIESAYLKEVVQQVSASMIEVYGIGVCVSMRAFRQFYPEFKGGRGKAPTGSIEIRSGEGLTDEVLRRLTRMLTRGYGMTRKAG